MDEDLGSGSTRTAPTRPWPCQPDLVTAACPFCVVMLTDGVAQRQATGTAAESVEVLDISEVLLRSVRADLGDPQPARHRHTHLRK